MDIRQVKLSSVSICKILKVTACIMSLSLALVGTARGIPMTFSTDASFLTAAGGGLTFESFETATAAGTTVTFPGGTFSCSGATFCPSFFGVSAAFADVGSQSVFFSTPDTATFTFGAAINAFGIALGGPGDVAPITLSALLSNGNNVTALSNHSGPFSVFGADRQYFGVIDTVPFTSITFSGSNSGDGIFFDSMSYGTAALTVPEPGTIALLGLGLVGLGFARRKKA